MELTEKDGRKTVLPYNDLVFKKTFASPENIHISESLLSDISEYDPLGLMSVTSIEVETPYNFKDVNELIADNNNDILITEVDFACKDINGARYTVEMQVKSLSYLEERLAYNQSQKYAQLYADVPKKEVKYKELQPVIMITILYDNYYEDHHVIRYLRPHDERIGVYKKNPNLGLEIFIELQKDVSTLPINLQNWIYYFINGKTLMDAPSYIQEAAKLTEITSYTKEERAYMALVDKAQQTRLAQLDYVKVKTTKEVTEKVTKEVTEQVTKEMTEKVKENSTRTAKSLLTTNMSIEEISKHSGLPEDEIIKLK